MSKILLAAILAIVAIAGGYFLLSGTVQRETPRDTGQPRETVAPADSPGPLPGTADVQTSIVPPPAPRPTFGMPKKSAHFESSTPAHGAILAAPPLNVVINVNFDLAPPSSISIVRDGSDEDAGSTIIDSNRLAMRREMSKDAPDGTYTVQYTACWPDKSCHDGHFQFVIDRALRSSFSDETGKREVQVRLKDIAFGPQNIRIRAGTTVTWTNDDAVEHYVNTDSHPAHTYFPSQNSRAMKRGDTYRVTFASPGVYPYHCSAHADTMTGTILAE